MIYNLNWCNVISDLYLNKTGNKVVETLLYLKKCPIIWHFTDLEKIYKTNKKYIKDKKQTQN